MLLDLAADFKCGYEETAEVWLLYNTLNHLDILHGHICHVLGNGYQQLLSHVKKQI